MNGYEYWDKSPNTICEGARVLTKTFYFDTDNEFKDRLVRVYLPSTYDFNNPSKRFKTIYMLDGKNLFDDYTSFVGEWGIDESIEKMISEGKDGYIVIGIDAPKTDISRTLEMTPDSLIFKRKIKIDRSGYASKLGNFIFEVVKPDIDKTFFTKSEKEFTGIGGSSMGGIAAFYLGIEHLNEVGYCLNFSPAFFLYTWKSFKDYLDANISRKLPKMFFYVGGNGFEKLFVEDTIKTFNYFLKHGYSHDEVKLLYVSHEEHNEKAWREYFPFAMTQIDK